MMINVWMNGNEWLMMNWMNDDDEWNDDGLMMMNINEWSIDRMNDMIDDMNRWMIWMMNNKYDDGWWIWYQ